MEENNIPPEETGLADELNEFVQHVPASTGQRFLNFLIDNLFMGFVLTRLTGYAVGYLLGSLFPEYMLQITADETNGELLLLSYIISLFNTLLYYSFCEKVFHGYTLGKLITGTRAIKENGQELTFRDTFLRTLSRLVPFEAFSGFGDRPWHDSWTKTMVIKAR